MAALTITAAQVLPTADTQLTFGTAAVAITAGQSIYLDTTTSTWKLFDANDSAANTQPPAVALTSSGALQPIVVAVGGTITLGAGAAPTLALAYICGATPGDIAPISDLASNWKLALLGAGGATNTLVMKPWNSGTTKA